MSTINRRTFIKGTTAGSLFVLTLAGCSEKKDTPAKSAQTQGTAAGLKQASAKPHYVMVFDQNKCVGCGECKEACAETNKTPAGVFRLALERQNGREPGTACPYCGKIEPCDCERKYVRVSCQQCLDAPCVRVCPTQAAHRDPETNIVTMDPDKCVGCKYASPLARTTSALSTLRPALPKTATSVCTPSSLRERILPASLSAVTVRWRSAI